MKFTKITNEIKKDTSLEESRAARKAKMISCYKKYAHISDSDIITEDTIDDWAVNETCFQHNCRKDELIKELLQK